MINKNVNVEFEEVKLIFESFRTASVLVAERILFGESHDNLEFPMSKLLLGFEDIEGALNEINDKESFNVGDDADDFLYLKKCAVLSVISDSSYKLARRGKSNSMNWGKDKRVRRFLDGALTKYPEYVNFDLDALVDSAKIASEQLLAVCSVRKAIEEIAHVFQTPILTEEQKKEAIGAVLLKLKPRLYIDYESTLAFFSEHFPSMEEFYLFDMEYYDSYPRYWFV